MPVLCCFLVMAVTVALSRYVSLGSLAAAFTVGPLTAAWLGHAPQSDAALIIAVLGGALVALRHQDNVHRLLQGKERRLGGSRERAELPGAG